MASAGVFSAEAQAEGTAKDIESSMQAKRSEDTASDYGDSDAATTNVNEKDHENERPGSASSSERNEQIRTLARTFTQHSVRHGEGGDYVNPFLGSDNPLLDPASGSFSGRAWVKTLIGIQSRDPERYPQRVAGVSYKNLNVHGFGTPTDYQKSFGNTPLQLFSVVDKIRGRGKTKIQILRDFDGLVKSGEMLVVLGRPGRFLVTPVSCVTVR